MDLYERCKQLATTLNYDFSLKGRSLSADEVFSDTGLLPVIAERANKHCVLCFGYGIGVNIVAEEHATAGKKMVVDEKAPQVLALLFIMDVMIALAATSMAKGRVVLDELLLD